MAEVKPVNIDTTIQSTAPIDTGVQPPLPEEMQTSTDDTLDADWYRRQADKYAQMRFGAGITPTQTSPEIARVYGGQQGKNADAVGFLSRATDFATAFASAFDKSVANKQAMATQQATALTPKGDIDEARQQSKDDWNKFKSINDRFSTLQIVKDYGAASDAYNGLKALSNEDTKAAGIAMVFKFMKGLDPTSVVRESEYALAAGSGDILEKLAGYIRQLQGKGLPEGVREDFINASKVYLEALENHYGAELGKYQQVASKAGLDEGWQKLLGVTIPTTESQTGAKSIQTTARTATGIIKDKEWARKQANNPNATQQDLIEAEKILLGK